VFYSKPKTWEKQTIALMGVLSKERRDRIFAHDAEKRQALTRPQKSGNFPGKNDENVSKNDGISDNSGGKIGF
jgi:hypothetical protein